MKKIIIDVLIFVFLLFGVLAALRLFVGGGEDTWLCVKGEWVEHGHPTMHPYPKSPAALKFTRL